MKKEFNLPIKNVLKINGNKLIDYSQSDFRDYWNDNGKVILNTVENNLLNKWQNSFPSDGWFFDIGCGFGRNLPAYIMDSREIVLVDFALNHLQMAKEIYGGKINIHYIAANACNLPFKRSIFKAGISIRLFHHIDSPLLFLKELRRILETDAQCIVTFINKRSFFRILKYKKNSFVQEHAKLSTMIYGTHPQYFKKLVYESGFIIIKKKGSGFIHQLSHSNKRISNLVNSKIFSNGFLINLEKFFSYFFGSLSLSLIQFYMLKSRTYNNQINQNVKNPIKLIDILACPDCHYENLTEDTHSIICNQCHQVFLKKDGIIDFTKSIPKN